MALTDNLVSYWKLDESSGNAADSAGSNTGVNTSVTYAAGKINNGAVFNGSASLALTAANLELTSLTINLWMKRTDTGTGCLFQNVYDAATFAGFLWYVNSTTITFDYGNNTGTTVGTNLGRISQTAATLNDGNWHMLTITFDNATDTSILYFDGIRINTYNTYTGGLAYNASGTAKIAANGVTPLTGSMDEIGVWSRALTSGEVFSLYNSGNGQAYPLDTVAGAYGKVTDTNDDVFDDGSAIDLNGDAELIIGEHPSLSVGYTGGFRFTNLGIPQGATINDARLKLVNQGNSTGTPTLAIEGEDADDAATFSTHANFAARSRTSANVAWNPGAQTSGTALKSVDVKTVVQEIVDRGSWSSGNDLVLFVKNNGGTNAWILVYDYTGSADNSAELYVSYSLGDDYSITCDVGSFTLTGVDSLFNKALSVIASVGSFTLTGIDVAFNFGKGIIASVGSFILTGNAVSLTGTGSFKWRRQSKNTSSWSNEDKNSSTWTNQSKN